MRHHSKKSLANIFLKILKNLKNLYSTYDFLQLKKKQEKQTTTKKNRIYIYIKIITDPKFYFLTPLAEYFDDLPVRCHV